MGTYRIENWPSAPATIAPELQKEFAAHAGDGRVGNELLSETDRVRVWAIGLKPGQRLGFHTHVLDYFWTSVTGGHGRSHFSDGRVLDTTYKPGDIKQLTFKEGEFMSTTWRIGLALGKWRALLKERGAFHGQAAATVREGICGRSRSVG